MTRALAHRGPARKAITKRGIGLGYRADLETRGRVFKTRSPTETLVHLYEEKGLDFVDELNGQFVTAQWDSSAPR